MTSFTELVGCRLPLQQAGMGGGISTAELAAAVTEAGGLGTVTASRARAAAVSRLLDDVEARTGGPFAVNFLVPFIADDAAVSEAARRARVVEFFWGEPDRALIDQVHVQGALAGWQVGSLREARAAAGAGCDVITVQGIEAGGHVRGHVGLLTLLAQAVEAIDAVVVAAGGLGSAPAVRAALAAGAQAVRIGTRFLAAAESGAHPAYVERLVAAEPEDTLVTTAFGHGWPDAPHRVLRSCVEAARRVSDHDPSAWIVAAGGEVAVPPWSTQPPVRTARGSVDAMPHYAGESVAGVHGVQRAGDIVAELLDLPVPEGTLR